MPAPGIFLIVVAVILVAAIAAGLTAIIIILLRVSSALAEAESNLSGAPTLLAPLGPGIARLANVIVSLRSAIVGD
jgi:hypothetical protein